MGRYMVGCSDLRLDGKLQPGDSRWALLNRSFDRLAMTPHALAWAIDEGRSFAAWFNGVRRESNFVLAQHVGVDCDNASVQMLIEHPFVAKYGTIIYRTMSSTDAQPRSRVVFMLDEPIHQAVNYRRVIGAVTWQLREWADVKCAEPARFFYGCLGSMPAVREALILPLSRAKELVEAHETELKVRPVPHVQPFNGTNGMPIDWYQRLVQSLSDSRADNYEDWITVGMACSTLGPMGLAIWKEFSKRSPKYREGECDAKWRGFVGHGVTMASVVAMARMDSQAVRYGR